MTFGLSLFTGLFGNLALLVILVGVYGFIRDRVGSCGAAKRQAAIGLAFGLFVVICMRLGIGGEGGPLLDQRAVFVILAGAFGGPLAAGIAAAAGAAYRIAYGGQGVARGIMSLGIALALGCACYAGKGRIDTTWKAAIASLAAAAFQLLGFLPGKNPGAGWPLVVAMSLPFGAATAIGIFLGAVLLEREDRRREAQEALRVSEAKYRELFESLPDLIYRLDPEGRISMISPSCTAILGYEPGELLGIDASVLYADASRRRAMEDAIARDGKIVNFDIVLIRKDSSLVAVSANAKVGLDAAGKRIGIDGIVRDVSALKRAEGALRASLAERDALLMELYHRANNNMQIIASYLRLQAEALGDPKVDALARSLASRIHAMSLIYEKLYRSKSLSRINAREYIEELVPLIEAYDGGGLAGRIRVEIEAEDIDLQVDSAMPLGLVLGEIVGNSFKHAFPGDRRGTIRIALRRLDGQSVLLEVADDGVGLPTGLDPLETTSFGISTMLSVVRQQMRGSAEVRSDGGGLSYRITAKDRLYAERF